LVASRAAETELSLQLKLRESTLRLLPAPPTARQHQIVAAMAKQRGIAHLEDVREALGVTTERHNKAAATSSTTP
jgi:hypothetical protein